MKLLSIQVGLPQSKGTADAHDLMDRAWTSGIFKTPITGGVEVSLTGLAGDGQADLKNHGGPDKAINAYPADYAEVWREELDLDYGPGGFGENFTTQRVLEDEACIGDILPARGSGRADHPTATALLETGETLADQRACRTRGADRTNRLVFSRAENGSDRGACRTGAYGAALSSMDGG